MLNFNHLKNRNGKIESIILALLILTYLVSRLVFLDSDILIWEKSHYSPVDEFYYTSQAFDAVEGIHSPDGKLLTPASSAFNILEQIGTTVTLYALGDNYFGLRVPSVIAGLTVLVLFFLMTLQRFGLAYATSFSIMLMSVQNFTLASRIAEPTIFRMATAAAVLFILTRQDYTQKNQLRAIGFLACLAWLFVYPTNAFLGLFGFIVVLLSNTKKLTASAIHYLTGAVACAFIYILTYYAMGNTLNDVIATTNLFSGRLSSETELSFLKQAYIKLRDVARADFFTAHPLFLILSLLSTALITTLFLTRSQLLTRTDKAVLIFSGCFLLQCAFVNDYPERKLVFILPACLYLCLLAAKICLSVLPRKISGGLFFLAVTASTVAFAVPTFKNVYSDPQYTYKSAMENLSTLNDERVIGGWGFGFRLYNNYKPYLNQYVVVYSQPEHYYAMLKEAGKHGDAKFTIEYGDDKTEKKMNNIDFYKENLVFKTNDPIYPDMYLYKFHENQKNESGL